MKVLNHHFVSHDGQSSYTPHTEDVVGFAGKDLSCISFSLVKEDGEENSKTASMVGSFVVFVYIV